MTTIRLSGDAIEIEHLTVHDPVLRDLLSDQPEDRRVAIVERALSTGARGLMTMGLGIDLTDLDATVRRSVEGILVETRKQVEGTLRAAREAFVEHLDPERRSSALARALAELADWREDFLQRVDPELATSHTSRFLREVEDLVGEGGTLAQWLDRALDPAVEGSAFSHLTKSIDEKLDGLRDLVVEQRAKREEADHGTRKGFRFEDVVEEQVRQAAQRLGGCVVERTSRDAGRISDTARVGDLTVTLPTGDGIVVEAKDAARIALTGRDGILDELERAMVNRGARFAICVSAQDAYPAEVGALGCYGNKLLVVETGDGTMVDVALRWAAATLAAERQTGTHIDPVALVDRLQEIRSLAQLFSSNRRSLTDIGRSIENVQASLGEMRSRLLALTDEILAEIGLGHRPDTVSETGDIVELRSHAADRLT